MVSIWPKSLTLGQSCGQIGMWHGSGDLRGGCSSNSTTNLNFCAVIGAADWDEKGLAARDDQVLRQRRMVADTMLICTGDIANDRWLCGGVEIGWHLLVGKSGLDDCVRSN